MSTPLLSVVIPCLDDPSILDTVASIRETAPLDVQIVVVNDSSTINLGWHILKHSPNVVVVENRNRIGSGPSRHLGALYAAGEWLLHTDSHMRFTPGWLQQALEAITHTEHDERATGQSIGSTVFCATMIALEADGSEHGRYAGATLNVLGQDPGMVGDHYPGAKGGQQVFEANWLTNKPEHGAEIPCVMGACYFVQRDWYLALSPHRFLRSWGKEEEMLSVKTWLAGGKVRYLATVEIGHIFRGAKERVPYEIPQSHLLYNKLFCLWTLLPKELRTRLIEELGRTEPTVHLERAKALIAQDVHIVTTEMATMPRAMMFEDYCRKFAIPLP